MAGTKSASLAGVKRKRDPSKPERRESKTKSRRKSPSESEGSEGGEDIQSEIALLEAQILESRRHYNNVATLVRHAKRSDAGVEGSILAAVALVRVFSRLLATGDMARSKGMGEAEATIVAWLKARYQELLDVLLDGFLRSEHPPKQSVALTLVMRLVKAETKSQKDCRLKSSPLPRLIQVLLSLPQDDLNREEYAKKYFNQFDDIRYQTFTTIKCVYPRRA
jgi:U3 small nucleolar RNA-associated protein 19